MVSQTECVNVVLSLQSTEAESTNFLKHKGNQATIQHLGEDLTVTFDGIFVSPSNKELYESHIQPLTKKALEGYNIGLIRFGMSDAATTYRDINTEVGIVSRMSQHIFKYIKKKPNEDILLSMSFAQCKDDVLVDLLNPSGRNLITRYHPYKGIYVDGLTEIVAKNSSDIRTLYEQGLRFHDVSDNNKRSSTILTINVEKQSEETAGLSLCSTIKLIDLAGIEVQPPTSELKTLMDICSSSVTPNYSSPPSSVQPSNFLQLIQNLLGGNSHTLGITSISQSESDEVSAIQILRLSENLKTINNNITLNTSTSADVVSKLRSEISKQRHVITKSSHVTSDDAFKLEELVKDLEVAKKQTLSERIKISQLLKQERLINLSKRGLYEWVIESTKYPENSDSLIQKEKDKVMIECATQSRKVDSLKEELQKHLLDYTKFKESGKIDEKENQKKVSLIYHTKESLKQDGEKLKTMKHKLCQLEAKLSSQPQIEEISHLEERNKDLILQETERSKKDLAKKLQDVQMKVQGGNVYSSQEGAKIESDLVQIQSELSVMKLELHLLQKEKDVLKQQLADSQKVLENDLERQKLQHFQTFREYRETFEQQRHLLDLRYRNLLQDSIRDAVYLASRNDELQNENESLRQTIERLKDELVRHEAH